MAAATHGDGRGLEELVAATKASHRSPARIESAGLDPEVFRERRRILESISAKGEQLTAYPAVVAQPYLIWNNPLDIIVDSRIEPGNSWARVRGSRSSSGDPYFQDTVSFYYYWDNPSAEYYTLVNVASTLVTKGIVVATGNTGFFSGGYASLQASTSLILYQRAGEQPLTPQAAQHASMYGVEARGGGFWSLSTGNVKSRNVFYEANVEYRYLPVPPGARAVFEVRLTLSTTIWPDGSTSFDFARSQQDDYVKCPALTITVLSGPLTVANQ